MSNYTPITDFSVKDALATGNPSKLILGSEVDAEFSAIQTAVNSKLDDISTYAAETVLATGDSIPLYDLSATTTKRITVSNARLAMSSWAETGFYAASSATTSCTDNAYTRITLGTEYFDGGNNFSSNYYNVPANGLYVFMGCVAMSITSAITTTVTGGLIVASSSDVTISAVNWGTNITQAASTPAIGGVLAFNLTANQRVYLAGFQNNGGTRSSVAGGASYLLGWRLS